MQRVFDFMNTLPFYFSFHDQIVCMLYLLNGKFARLQRLLYCYDMGAWEAVDTAQAKDVEFYKNAGMDPVVNKLQWFLCGFEGATLIRNADAFPDYPLEIRQTHGRSVVFGELLAVQKPSSARSPILLSPPKPRKYAPNCKRRPGNCRFKTCWLKSGIFLHCFPRRTRKNTSRSGTRRSIGEISPRHAWPPLVAARQDTPVYIGKKPQLLFQLRRIS